MCKMMYKINASYFSVRKEQNNNKTKIVITDSLNRNTAADEGLSSMVI